MMNQRLNGMANRFSEWSNQMTRINLGRTAWFASAICLAGLAGGQGLAQAEGPKGSANLAQAYEMTPPPPDAAIPVPSAGSMPPSTTGGNQTFGGQQYVVFVNGSSDMLLDQVRLVEPTAFRTNHEGRTVIQAGRFNSPQNAQQRLNELSMQGIGASVAEVGAAVPYYAQSPVQTPNIYAANGELPPIPAGAVPSTAQVVPETQQVPVLPAVPTTSPMAPPSAGMAAPAAPVGQGSVEFGEELAYGATPNPNAYPVNTTPPGTAAAIPATSARVSAPYYVVIPTNEGNLPELSTEIIQLGTPADRVQQRLSPRGPHVAVGPFEDRDLAFQWNRFYREAGIANSRVHYDP